MVFLGCYHLLSCLAIYVRCLDMFMLLFMFMFRYVYAYGYVRV